MIRPLNEVLQIWLRVFAMVFFMMKIDGKRGKTEVEERVGDGFRRMDTFVGDKWKSCSISPAQLDNPQFVSQ